LLEQRLQESRKKIDQQEATIEQNMHSGHANKLLMDRMAMPNGGVSFKQDEKGMDAAYGYKSFPGAAYDSNTQTLYVAGSDSWESWFHDDPLIPLGKTGDAARYKQAERAYDDLIKSGHPVNRVVGHSLGGSVALELAKQKGTEFSRVFGAPVADANFFKRGSNERYRHVLDPVSVFDRGAIFGSIEAQPHSYGGFQGFDRPTPTPIRGRDLDHATLALRARSGYSYA
jgi:pimeloyl-ACP methyl ester carboxylesterase